MLSMRTIYLPLSLALAAVALAGCTAPTALRAAADVVDLGPGALTQPQMETKLRGLLGDSTITRLDLAARTRATTDARDQPVTIRFWFARVEGDLDYTGVTHSRPARFLIGRSPLRASAMDLEFAPNGDGPHGAGVFLHGPRDEAGMFFDLQPLSRTYLAGEALSFFTRGTWSQGLMRLDLSQRSTGATRSYEVPYAQLGSFVLPATEGNLPIAGANPIQHFDLRFTGPANEPGGVAIGTASFAVALSPGLKRPDPYHALAALDTVPAGLQVTSDPGSRSLDAALERYRQLAWNAAPRTMNVEPVASADLAPAIAIRPYAGYPLWRITLTGLPYTYLVPAEVAPDGKESLLQPSRVELVVSQCQPPIALQLRVIP